MSTPKKRWLRENAYRDCWLVLISIGLLLTAEAALNAANKATHVARTAVKQTAEIQEGRRTGTTIQCVITSSILRGSHSFIIAAGSAPLPGKIEARLIREGYPSKTEREHSAVKQADQYTTAIAEAVIAAAGPEAKGLIVETTPTDRNGPSAGTVNCTRLKTITKAH